MTVGNNETPRDPIIHHFGRTSDAEHQRAFFRSRAKWRVNVIAYPVWMVIVMAPVVYWIH